MAATTKINFYQQVKNVNEVLDFRGADFRISHDRIYKAGQERDAYCLKPNNGNVGIVVYLDDDMRSMDPEETASELERFYLKKASDCQELDAKNIYEKIINHLTEYVMPKLVNGSEIYQLESHGIAYKQFLNLAITYYVPVSESGLITIKTYMLDRAGISADDLYKSAIRNASGTYKVQRMSDLLNTFGEEENILVVTNKDGRYGASVLLDPQMITRLGVMENVLIIPSSVHEILVYKIDDKAEIPYYIDMVREVNRTAVAPEDRLADSLYSIQNNQVVQIA